jgi:hypothetical protein
MYTGTIGSTEVIMKKFEMPTGHIGRIEKVEEGILDAVKAGLPGSEKYTEFWAIYHGAQTWMVARGYPGAFGQHVVWYPNNKMCVSYGWSKIEAMTIAFRDAWMYI